MSIAIKEAVISWIVDNTNYHLTQENIGENKPERHDAMTSSRSLSTTP